MHECFKDVGTVTLTAFKTLFQFTYPSAMYKSAHFLTPQPAVGLMNLFTFVNPTHLQFSFLCY